jgi:hypothetical protein
MVRAKGSLPLAIPVVAPFLFNLKLALVQLSTLSEYLLALAVWHLTPNAYYLNDFYVPDPLMSVKHRSSPVSDFGNRLCLST